MEWLSRGVTARRKRNVRRKNNILIFKNDYENQRSEFLKSITKTNINISEIDNLVQIFWLIVIRLIKALVLVNHKKNILVTFLISLLEVKKLELLEKMVQESQHF